MRSKFIHYRPWPGSEEALVNDFEEVFNSELHEAEKVTDEEDLITCLEDNLDRVEHRMEVMIRDMRHRVCEYKKSLAAADTFFFDKN